MATNCEQFLTADISRNCDVNPIAGLEVNDLHFNKKDINYSALTFSGTNDLVCTNFQLLSGKTGYLLEGVKQTNYASEELVVKENRDNAYKHLFGGIILTPSVANRKSAETLLAGGEFVAIVEKKWKGVDPDDAYAILGLDAGLTASSGKWHTKEEDGSIVFELASADGYEEPHAHRTLLHTDYATTKTAFGNKFAQA